jgi:hypothetical protein
MYFGECTLNETLSEQWIRDIHHSPMARTLDRDLLSQPQTWSLYVGIGINPGKYASPTTDCSHCVSVDRGLDCSSASISTITSNPAGIASEMSSELESIPKVGMPVLFSIHDATTLLTNEIWPQMVAELHLIPRANRETIVSPLRPHLPDDTRLHIFHLLTFAVAILLPANVLSSNRASSPLRHSSRFFGLVVVNEQFALLAVASRHLACDFDDSEGTFEAMHLVEDVVHFFERPTGGFGLEGRC